MGRRSKLSTTVLARVRYHFGLDQAMLAAYLGIAPALVGHLEAGRRAISGAVLMRLTPLARLVPDDEPPAAEAATALLAANPPAPGPLAARLDYCQHHAARLRRELRPLLQAAEMARRWRQVLPALLADATPGSAAHTWLLRREEQAAADLDGEASAQYHLLRLRAEALETEAAALTRLLAATNG